ncbi:MAG: methyltransferase domain-containing protein [Acidobacteria bacterium]|nr:methyltransferase domain-containing protein [Acidobacteriota bacterium]MBV9067240.1 methyltransferase domain-containing protein [Acidobacteriota bacterium]MBV9187368.1 methyltransferase domain-containing protein [Acidobacteriota bacterium]
MLPFETEVAQIYDEIGAHYGETIDQFQSLPAANQYRKLYELTESYVAPGSAVLDWGCGRGHFSYYLLKRGYRVTAYSLEDSPQVFTALSAEERSRLTLVRGNEAVLLPFPANSFDAAFSVGVLEHVREVGGTESGSLKELRRVLSSAGTLIAYHVPNRLSYIEALARVAYGRRYRHVAESVKFHKFRFGASNLAALVGDAGFAMAEFGRYGFLPRNSFNRLPASLRSGRRLTSAVNIADHFLERLFAPVVQNFYFVARAKEA